MNKQELQRSLEKHGTFLNVSQTAKILGMTREATRKNILDGLPYLENGKEKLFFTGDITERILERAKFL